MATTTSQPFQEGKLEHLHLHHGGRALPSVYGGMAPLPASSVPPPLPRLEMSSSSMKSTAEAQQALKIHREAERRRRERINAHLATLRRMIPDARQMDKATLLARVVSQLKDLKNKSSERTQPPLATIPAEANGIAVHCYTGAAAATGYERPPPAATYVRASVSCDDRPGLHADLAAEFRAMRLRPLRADVAALGGRAQCDFLLCRDEEGGGGVMTTSAGGGQALRALEEGIRQALARAAFPETMTPYGWNGTWSRRQRLVGSSHCVLLGHGHGLHVGEHG